MTSDYSADYSTGESLVLSNPDFQIRQLMEFAPRDLQCREAAQNCYEAFQHPNEKIREIFIRARHWPNRPAPVLSFLNTGVGMSRTEMADLSNINNSLKTIGIITDNRGEGIKVAGSANNPKGIRWITRKDGHYYTSSIGIDPVSKAWKRLRMFAGEDGYVTAWEIYPTAEECAAWPVQGDFVEVLFFGQSPDQNTFADPRGTGERRNDTVWNDLMMRYYKKPIVSRVTIPSVIRYQSNPDGDPLGGTELKFSDEVIYGTPRDYDEETCTIEDGVQIRYVLAKSGAAATRIGTGGHMALVFQAEKYDVRVGNPWTRVAPSFGISTVQNLLSVFVILPDSYKCYGDRYRKNLILGDTKKELTCDDFRMDIAQNIPKWLQDKMTNNIAKPAVNTNTIQKIKEFMKDLPLIRKLGLMGGDYMTGRGSANRSTNQNHVERTPPAEPSAPRKRNDALKGVADPSGKSRAEAQPPAIRWIEKNDLNEIENSALRGRIAEYRPGPSGGTLVLNEWSPTFRLLVAMLLKAGNVPDGLEQIASKIANPLLKNKLELRIVQSMMIRMSLRGTLDWTDAQVEMCLKPEGLENFATCVYGELKMLQRNLLTANPYRMALAQHTGTSGVGTLTVKISPVASEDDDEEVVIFP